MREEKEEMKKMLWTWGDALEKLQWKENELQKQKKYWEAVKALGEQISNEWTEQEYKERTAEIRQEMKEILQEKVRLDSKIKGLDFEEQQFVGLRFEKGYSFDYIGMKMHRSRATLFRLQDRILEKLLEGEKLRLHEMGEKVA